jgi:hypothetical protein
MKKLVICLAVCFILFSATQAQAGRGQLGDAASPYCDCGRNDGVPCYDETTWQRCDGDQGLMLNASSQKSKPESLPSGRTRDTNAGSIGLLVLVTALLLKRFMV